MICQNCWNENKPDATFCANCGSKLAEPAATTQPIPPAQTVPPVAQPPAPATPQPAPYVPPTAVRPTQPMPQAPAYPPVQPYAAAPQVPGYAPAQPYAPPPGAPPGTPLAPPAGGPPPKSRGGLVAGVIVAVIVVLLLCCGGGYFGYRYWTTPKPGTTGGSVTPTATPTSSGFPAAEAALQDTLAKQGASNYVYKITEQSQGRFLYWIGPPNSEFTDEVTVTQNPDGTWTVQSVQALGGGQSGTEQPGGSGSGAQGTSANAAQDAVKIVNKFLGFVKTNKGNKAHALTIEPFASDGASAGMGAGDLLSWDINSANVVQQDGTVEVDVTEHWKSAGNMNAIYTVNPTSSGYRISQERVP